MSERIQLNLEGIKTLEDFHDLVFATFSFPPYYGRNKDAFWDCITDFVGEVTVEVDGEVGLTEQIRSLVSEYLEMLVEYEKETDGEFKVIIK